MTGTNLLQITGPADLATLARQMHDHLIHHPDDVAETHITIEVKERRGAEGQGGRGENLSPAPPLPRSPAPLLSFRSSYGPVPKIKSNSPRSAGAATGPTNAGPSCARRSACRTRRSTTAT